MAEKNDPNMSPEMALEIRNYVERTNAAIQCAIESEVIGMAALIASTLTFYDSSGNKLSGEQAFEQAKLAANAIMNYRLSRKQ